MDSGEASWRTYGLPDASCRWSDIFVGVAITSLVIVGKGGVYSMGNLVFIYWNITAEHPCKFEKM